jgi:Flp pilus assembly protein TadD/outer membrane protein OmpA-like peptidoglycan-associated protein
MRLRMSFTSKTLLFASAISLVGCGKFNLDLVKYKVTPSPLEFHNDSVAITISADYPAKLMPRKAEATATPFLLYKGGEKAFTAVSFRGDKAEGSGQVISRDGGSIKAYRAVVPYTDAMSSAELHVRATGGIKGKERSSGQTSEPIALGTITTPLLALKDERFSVAPNNYGPVFRKQTVRIYFPYNSATIRPGERTSEEMKAFRAFVDSHLLNNSTLEGVEISGWASPDGEETRNMDLSSRRAAAVKGMMEQYFSKEKKSTVAISSNGRGEDKSGFQTRLSASSSDKKDDVRSRINSGVRNAELRTLGAAVYNELEKNVLGPLRRAEVVLTVKERQKTNEELMSFAMNEPAKLNVEEFLHTAATLAQDNATRLQILANAERQYPEDWRAFNNRGIIYALEGKLDDAMTEFMKAEKLASSEKSPKNNIGAIYGRKGDRQNALKYFEEARGSGLEVNHNLGSAYIRLAKYSEAVSLFGTECSFNAALATILAGSPEKASAIIDCGPDKELAISFYLKAVASARTKSNQAVIDNLRAAFSRDAGLKVKAKSDLEFLRLRDNADFKGLVN